MPNGCPSTFAVGVKASPRSPSPILLVDVVNHSVGQWFETGWVNLPDPHCSDCAHERLPAPASAAIAFRNRPEDGRLGDRSLATSGAHLDREAKLGTCRPHSRMSSAGLHRPSDMARVRSGSPTRSWPGGRMCRCTRRDGSGGGRVGGHERLLAAPASPEIPVSLRSEAARPVGRADRPQQPVLAEQVGPGPA